MDGEDATAAALPPDDETAALAALGFSKPLIAALFRRAMRNGTSLEAELLRRGVREEAYYGAMARLLRLPFLDRIDPADVTDGPFIDVQLQRPNQIRIAHRYRAPQVAIVPEAERLSELAAVLGTLPPLGRDLVITTPSAIRNAVWAAGALRRVRETTGDLFEHRPHLSARVVLSGEQGFYIGAAATSLIACLAVAPIDTLLLLHVVLSLVYLTTLLLRSAALFQRKRQGKTIEPPLPVGPLPRYTVMVALYREAEVAEQLIASLDRLDWPTSLLDIKLVCEADDHDTLAALRAQKPGAHFEIIEVPPSLPRTKPKALSYALKAARGEFLAIYDAEDRPHPGQLLEAYRRFRSLPGNVVCLQAPLIITNIQASWISALFSLEYSGLFRSLLPMLARGGMPLPLGGTSNHFRTEALREAGGWDPFNVTEDADLGLRFYRLGYQADVLKRQTLEDAPTNTTIWMGQRSRWFKGWLQTWLVLMRDPRRLIREMGFAAFAVFNLTIGGMLISALLHPLIIVFLGFGTVALFRFPASEIPLGTFLLLAVDLVNIFGSYLVFVALGLKSMIAHERRLVRWRWMAVPVYWMMTSAAAWRAVYELRSKPFVWNKTPHRPVAKRDNPPETQEKTSKRRIWRKWSG